MSTGFSYHGDSIIGGRSENQDSFGYIDTKFGFLCLVCDGMGGGKGGKKASTVATDVILEDIQHSKSNDPVNAIYNAIQKANFEVFRLQVNDEHLKGMGTTVALLLLTKEKAIVAHVGDSRIYQIRQNEIINKTGDHSVVFKMLRDGILKSEEEARIHPRSNEITRALGLGPVTDIELQEWEFKKNDRFFLCSDGVNGEIRDLDLLQIISLDQGPEQIVKTSLQRADQAGLQSGGGHDNATAIIVFCKQGPQLVSQKMFDTKKTNQKKGSKFEYTTTRNLFFPLFLAASGLLVLFTLLSFFASYSQPDQVGEIVDQTGYIKLKNSHDLLLRENQNVHDQLREEILRRRRAENMLALERSGRDTLPIIVQDSISIDSITQ